MLQRIGKYEILEQIGRGGQGTVYRARDTDLDRIVAVKVIDQSVVDDPGYLDALRREAQLAASLDHPNIVSVYAFEVENDTPYIVMEYVPDALDRQIRSERLGIRRAVEIAEQVCLGLAHAHELGVVHRDIKPANILISETGEAKVTDFGIARAVLSSTRAPHTSAAGTYHYLPPEQWEENPAVDRRSDIYAVGVTLFEMLVGEVPFPGNAVLEVHRQHQQDPVPPLPRNIRAPSGLGDIIHKAMAKKPELRFQAAADMARELSGLFGTSSRERRTPPVSAPTATTLEMPPAQTVVQMPGSRPERNVAKWMLFGGVGAAVIAVIAVVAIIASSGGGPDAVPVETAAVPEPAFVSGASGTVPTSGDLSLEADSGSIKALLPQGAAPVGSVLSVAPVALESLPPFPDGLSPTKHAFDVSLVSATGEKAELSGEVTVSVVFGDAVVESSDKDVERLVIGHFKEGLGELEQLPTQVEWETKTAWARVSSLSPFALLVRDPVETAETTKDPFGSQMGVTLEEPTAVPTPTPSPVPTATAIPTPTVVPTPTPGPYAKADSYRQGEYWSLAIREYKTVIDADPSDRDAYFFRAYS